MGLSFSVPSCLEQNHIQHTFCLVSKGNQKEHHICWGSKTQEKDATPIWSNVLPSWTKGECVNVDALLISTERFAFHVFRSAFEELTERRRQTRRDPGNEGVLLLQSGHEELTPTKTTLSLLASFFKRI